MHARCRNVFHASCVVSPGDSESDVGYESFIKGSLRPLFAFCCQARSRCISGLKNHGDKKESATEQHKSRWINREFDCLVDCCDSMYERCSHIICLLVAGCDSIDECLVTDHLILSCLLQWFKDFPVLLAKSRSTPDSVADSFRER